jgi:hypothetical protein
MWCSPTFPHEDVHYVRYDKISLQFMVDNDIKVPSILTVYEKEEIVAFVTDLAAG